jgi:hypothetical protein
MAVKKYTKPVQESQVKNYPKIDLGKLCKQSIVFGYSGITSGETWKDMNCFKLQFMAAKP